VDLQTIKHIAGLPYDDVAAGGSCSELGHMKNFMPNQSAKSVDSRTFATSPHQQRAGSTPEGKLACFIFLGLIPSSEQGKLIARWEKEGRTIKLKERKQWWEKVDGD
jgi:hypothetical protein